MVLKMWDVKSEGNRSGLRFRWISRNGVCCYFTQKDINNHQKILPTKNTKNMPPATNTQNSFDKTGKSPYLTYRAPDSHILGPKHGSWWKHWEIQTMAYAPPPWGYGRHSTKPVILPTPRKTSNPGRCHWGPNGATKMDVCPAWPPPLSCGRPWSSANHCLKLQVLDEFAK